MTYQADCQSLQVPDAATALGYPLFLFYPTQLAAASTPIGSYSLEVAMQAPYRVAFPEQLNNKLTNNVTNNVTDFFSQQLGRVS